MSDIIVYVNEKPDEGQIAAVRARIAGIQRDMALMGSLFPKIQDLVRRTDFVLAGAPSGVDFVALSRLSGAGDAVEGALTALRNAESAARNTMIRYTIIEHHAQTYEYQDVNGQWCTETREYDTTRTEFRPYPY